jgi:acyl-CoA thioester hydrolase
VRKGKLGRQSYFEPEPGAPPPLRARTTRRVRFEELDPLRIVWHGRYVSYFEDGRVAFGREYGLSYEEFMQHRLAAPIVSLHIDYLTPLAFDDLITIEATLHWSTAMRLNFEFAVFTSSGEKAASGYSVQVLTDLKGNIFFVAPDWVEDFRHQWEQGLLHQSMDDGQPE